MEVFIIGDAKLTWLGDVGASIDGDISRVDQFTVRKANVLCQSLIVQQSLAVVLRVWGSWGGTDFCLKYNSPLATTASPEEAKTGSRRK